MNNIPETLKIVKERYNLGDVQEALFNPDAKPVVGLYVEWLATFFQTMESIYLLDERSGKMAIVKNEETVHEALGRLSDDYRKQVVCLLFWERKQVAFVPEKT